MEQIDKTDSKPFAHIEKPCSMRMEQCGTNGTMLGTSNLLTPDNKFACVINIIISIGNYHQKTGHKKRAIKKPRLLGARKTLSG
jgi:hypothetical protein